MTTTKKLNRFAVALGGFLIFLGIIIIAVFLIGFLDLLDFTIIETEIQNLSLMLMMVIGLLDLVSGFLLLRR